jgi:hypothetical protein
MEYHLTVSGDDMGLLITRSDGVAISAAMIPSNGLSRVILGLIYWHEGVPNPGKFDTMVMKGNVLSFYNKEQLLSTIVGGKPVDAFHMMVHINGLPVKDTSPVIPQQQKIRAIRPDSSHADEYRLMIKTGVLSIWLKGVMYNQVVFDLSNVMKRFPNQEDLPDELRVSKVYRYKTSFASGDEWRASFGNVSYYRNGEYIGYPTIRELDTLLWVVVYMVPKEVKINGPLYGIGDLCDQTGCCDRYTVTYSMKDVSQQPHQNGIRKFCNLHSTRGDCSLEDCDDNYIVVDGGDDIEKPPKKYHSPSASIFMYQK